MSALNIQRLLIVEDQESLARALTQLLSEHAGAVAVAGTVRDAVEKVQAWHPDVVLLDMELPDGTAVDILTRLKDFKPTPTVVILTGTADPQASFQLGQLGARGYVRKPLVGAQVVEALATALASPPDVTLAVRGMVGQVPVQQVEETIRKEMVDEALARTQGSRSGAARLLAISRQLLQHILRRG